MYFGAALQFASAGPSSPLARELTVAVRLVPGIVTTVGVATGWAQTHGCSCSPAKTGPLAGWFVIVRRAVLGPFVFDFGPVGTEWATTSLSPSTSPERRPLNVSSARSANALVTSLPFSVTVTLSSVNLCGKRTSTSASPPEIRSARFESTRSPSSPCLGPFAFAGRAARSAVASAADTVKRSAAVASVGRGVSCRVVARVAVRRHRRERQQRRDQSKNAE